MRAKPVSFCLQAALAERSDDSQRGEAKQRRAPFCVRFSLFFGRGRALLRLRLVTASLKAASRMRSRAELLTLCLQLRAKRSQTRRAMVANVVKLK
ncbi:hypothetical protein CRECT_1469 [Campylobacter rectus]|uniref:Uncharacterized protein n=1 Tax=Campylobacter rectus TaxID=203 RepID=A0A6G5QND5_CAMRE|nr:hypothetical protein CRECT_1469 [Campylobacter rectus]